MDDSIELGGGAKGKDCTDEHEEVGRLKRLDRNQHRTRATDAQTDDSGVTRIVTQLCSHRSRKAGYTLLMSVGQRTTNRVSLRFSAFFIHPSFRSVST